MPSAVPIFDVFFPSTHILNNNIEAAPLQNLAMALKRTKKSLNKEAVLELVKSVFDTSNGQCALPMFSGNYLCHFHNTCYSTVCCGTDINQIIGCVERNSPESSQGMCLM